MISNTNGQVKWTKINCNRYSVENLTDKDITVEVTGETNDFTTQLVIEPNIVAEFEVPSDGVYKICINGCEEIVTIESFQDIAAVKTVLSTWTFGGAEPIDFSLLYWNGNLLYDAFAHGAANTDFAPGTANLFTRIETVVPAGDYQLIAPGQNPIAKFSLLGVDNDNWRLVMEHATDIGGEFRINYFEELPIDIQPSFYCRYELANYTGGNNWITGLVIDGVDVMALPTDPFRTRYDQTNGDDVSAFTSHLASYYIGLGFNPLISNNPWVILIPGLCNFDIEQITYASLFIDDTPIVWCDYLYELCSLYTCILGKLRDLMCLDCDPCKSDCSQEITNKKEKARKDVLYLSTLFFHGLVPLITKDRLNYLGDLTIDETRIECTMKLKEIYEKLVDFAKRCGECEDCDCDDCDCGCGCCEPNTTEQCNNC